MRKLLIVTALILLPTAPVWAPSANAQTGNMTDVCAVPAHFQVRNLNMTGGRGRAHTFSYRPGSFFGDISAQEAPSGNGSMNLALTGNGYVMVQCGHLFVTHLRCREAVGGISCYQPAGSGN